jgi:hypothetical protein
LQSYIGKNLYAGQATCLTPVVSDDEEKV